MCVLKFSRNIYTIGYLPLDFILMHISITFLYSLVFYERKYYRDNFNVKQDFFIV